MNDEQQEYAVETANRLMRELEAHVNREFKSRPLRPEVEEFVRTLLNEQARFWKVER